MATKRMHEEGKEKLVVPTTSELRTRWNRMAPLYGTFTTRTTSLTASVMWDQLQLEELEALSHASGGGAVLEIGCGAGAGSELFVELCQSMSLSLSMGDTSASSSSASSASSSTSKTTTTVTTTSVGSTDRSSSSLPWSLSLTAIDLSEEMVQLAQQRLQRRGIKGVEVMQGDAENLKFDDGKFDRVFANFVLHLVTDPARMLAECYRVLRKDGMAAFSVWGRRENSPLFELPMQVAYDQKLAGKKASVRDSFHLSDVSRLRQLAAEAGFQRQLAFYTFAPHHSQTAKQYVDYLSKAGGNVLDLLANRTAQEKQSYLAAVAERADRDYFAKGTVIGCEVAILVCNK